MFKTLNYRTALLIDNNVFVRVRGSLVDGAEIWIHKRRIEPKFETVHNLSVLWLRACAFPIFGKRGYFSVRIPEIPEKNARKCPLSFKERKEGYAFFPSRKTNF